jgi:hypothetical protein
VLGAVAYAASALMVRARSRRLPHAAVSLGDCRQWMRGLPC